MKKNKSSCATYVLHFETTYDVEVFGSISEIVNYFIDKEITYEGKLYLRRKIVDACQNSVSFQVKGNFAYQEFFVSKHITYVECKLSRKWG